MAGIGSRPGERRGGRQKGTTNKRTAERRLREGIAKKVAGATGADVATLTKAVNKVLESRAMAVDELASMMPVVRQIVEYHQTAPFKAANSGKRPSVAAWRTLKEWLELYLRWCDTLAAYQSPKLRAVAVHAQMVGQQLPAPEASPDGEKPPAGVLDAVEASRIYRRMLKAS